MNKSQIHFEECLCEEYSLPHGRIRSAYIITGAFFSWRQARMLFEDAVAAGQQKPADWEVWKKALKESRISKSNSGKLMGAYYAHLEPNEVVVGLNGDVCLEILKVKILLGRSVFALIGQNKEFWILDFGREKGHQIGRG